MYHLDTMPKKPAHSLTAYYFSLIIAYVIWAAAGPVIKLTVESVPPFTFLFLRLLVVCILVLPYTWRLLKTTSVIKKDYLKIFVLGVFSQSSLMLLFLGYKYTTVLDAVFIGMLGTILSVVAGHYLYNEKVDWNVKLGLLLATLGTLFVAIEPILQAKSIAHDIQMRLLGNLLVIAYSVLWVLYIVWSKLTMGINSANMKRTLKLLHIKPMKKHYSPVLLVSLSFYIGLLTVIPMALLEMAGFFGPISFSISQIALVPALGILYMAVFSSIIAYYLFEWSLEKIEVKDTALFGYLQTVFTIPFAYILLREIPNKYMLIGALVIALGVLIAEQKKS